MKKRIYWQLFTLALTSALLFGASESARAKTDGPKYGGTITVAWDQEPSWFDDVAGHGVYAYPLMLTNEDLLTGNWAASTQGSNLDGFNYTHFTTAKTMAGAIAERWEFLNETTIAFYIRKGIHFHNKPPTNGREVTAEDVVFSMKRLWETEGGYIYGSYSWKDHMESIEMPDKWTVVLHTKPGRAGIVFNIAGNFMAIVPKDAVEKFGNLLDWKNSIGTGPWILKEYVSGMSARFEKNPDYWGTDPLHPGNKVPYADEVRHLYIPDLSTRIAAVRTGKVDQNRNIPWEEGDGLTASNPKLKWSKSLKTTSPSLAWRSDKPNLPMHDVRVRRALMMAIDHKAIAQGLYGGNAEILAWPVMPTPDWADTYIPLDQLDRSIQEQYEYHPEKAKKLLAEAGYPKGFNVSIIAMSRDVDLLAAIKSFFAKVGVNLTIDVKEKGAMYSLLTNKKYEESTIWSLHSYQPFRFIDILAGDMSNMAMVNDPVVQKLHAESLKHDRDEAKRRGLLKEKIPYILEQAWWAQLPMPQVYTIWQPWLKGYGGETDVGYFNIGNWVTWAWVDQDLKP